MSSEEQGKSPDQQRQQILKLADRLQCRIVRWYEDLGISGDDIQRRKSFRRMVADASKRRDFKLILCWAQDRFGRFDSIEAGEWVAPLRRAGVKLVTVAEGEISWTDGAGRLVYTIQQEGKHTYLLDMARTTSRGRTQAVKQIGFVGGLVPYGYEREIYDEQGRFQRRLKRDERFRRPRDWKTLLVPSADPKEVATVRDIFRSYNAGKSVNFITYSLNKRSVASARGRYWRTTTVRHLLSNPVYMGDQVWNRRHFGKYFAIVNGEVTPAAARDQMIEGIPTTWNPIADWIVVPKAHPPIVSRSAFQRASTRLAKRRGRHCYCSGLPLTGLVICGHCGMRMAYHTYKGAYEGTPHAYYRIICASRVAMGPAACKHLTIREPWLLAAIIKLLSEKMLGPEVETRFRMQLKDELARNRRSPSELRKWSREVAKLDAQIASGVANLLLAGPLSVKGASAKLEEWQGRRANLVRLAENSQASSGAKVHTAIAELMTEIQLLRFGLASGERELLHHTLQRLIKAVTLWFEPDPTSTRRSRFARGVLEAQCPYVDGKVIPYTFEFLPRDLDTNPKWYSKAGTTPSAARPPKVNQAGQGVIYPEWVPLPESRV